jgi:hypothetical protein
LETIIQKSLNIGKEFVFLFLYFYFEFIAWFSPSPLSIKWKGRGCAPAALGRGFLVSLIAEDGGFHVRGHSFSLLPMVFLPNKANIGQNLVIPSATFMADTKAIMNGKLRRVLEEHQAKPTNPRVMRKIASNVPMFFCMSFTPFLCRDLLFAERGKRYTGGNQWCRGRGF